MLCCSRSDATALAYAGVELRSRMPIGATEGAAPLNLGTSANEAIRRGAAIGHAENRVRVGTDLLLGILGAELGTVPRILALAGIDRGPTGRPRQNGGKKID